MRLYRYLILCLIIISFYTISISAISASQVTDARISKSYGKLPLSFVENKGQMDKRARFVIRGPRASAFFRNDGVTFDLWEASKIITLNKRDMLQTMKPEIPSRPEKRKHAVLKLTFKGADPKCRVEGMDTLPGKVNYMIGNDKSKWHTDVPTYKGVIYKNIWKGIDIIYRGDRNQLKYDIRVNPGVDIRNVRLQYDGAQKMWLDKKGDLHIKTAVTEFIEKVPGIYQEKSGKKINVVGGYKLLNKNTVGFDTKNADPKLPLVIDPASDLVYSTLFSGSLTDVPLGIAVGSNGCAYFAGNTDSPNFPTTPGAYRISNYDTGDYRADIFVAKMNASGSDLEYSTYIGGIAQDHIYAIAIDSSGCAYVTGYTLSIDYPTTSGAFDTSHNSGYLDSFITKVNPSGSKLIYSTFLGGSGWDQSFGITVDQYDCAYVTGLTMSTDFPTTYCLHTIEASETDIFVTKMNSTGSGLDYSFQLGGSAPAWEYGWKITVDPIGCAYVVGFTGSADFPTTLGAFDSSFHGGKDDAVIFKINSSGTGLEYSTYLGGTGDDEAYGIALDQSGNVYILGQTSSTDFPTTSDAYDRSFNGGSSDLFITKLDPTFSNLLYSTYLGGAKDDYRGDIIVDSSGSVITVGFTKSLDFPTTRGASSRSYLGGSFDIYITKLNPAGSDLSYSTYFGTSSGDTANDLAKDSAGFIYFTGPVCYRIPINSRGI